MILPKTTQPPFEADLSSLTEEQQENIKSTRYRSDTDDYEVEFNEKYERNLLKEKAKRLKAENKLLRDRITDAVDFVDLKEKFTKVKDSETDPTKWSDKTDYLQGQYVEHKGIIFLVLVDHASDKDKEPPDTPEWYEEVQ